MINNKLFSNVLISNQDRNFNSKEKKWQSKNSKTIDEFEFK